MDLKNHTERLYSSLKKQGNEGSFKSVHCITGGGKISCL